MIIFLHRRDNDNTHNPLQPPYCAIQCQGRILATIQVSGVFNDSKTFVDMPMRLPPDDIRKQFNALPDHTPAHLRAFVLSNFAPAGSDLTYWTPEDYKDEPPFLTDILDLKLRKFGQHVHSLWNVLGRKIADDVYTYPERHTLIPLKKPYMMVPGGRFREFCKFK